MLKENAANSEIIWRKIDSNVSLSIMPSNNGQNVFKAKSILKPKSVKKIQKPDKNKENKGENIKEKEVPKQHSKQKSLIPRPSSKTSTERNSRQGEYQKYAVESKDREKSIPTKIPSRKSSVCKIPKPKMKETSKTEMLYQKAREAMEKSKKTNGKNEFYILLNSLCILIYGLMITYTLTVI